VNTSGKPKVKLQEELAALIFNKVGANLRNNMGAGYLAGVAGLGMARYG
jgi:hypothetical protein